MDTVKNAFGRLAKGMNVKDSVGEIRKVIEIGRQGQQRQTGNWFKIGTPDGGSITVGEKDFGKYALLETTDDAHQVLSERIRKLEQDIADAARRAVSKEAIQQLCDELEASAERVRRVAGI